METILIAGGTGLIGKRLSAFLEEEGYSVRHLSRHENLQARFPAYRWDPETGVMDPKALEGVSYVINLAGAGIADKPWTEGRKRMITSSRVRSTLLLRDALLKTAQRPKAYLSGAAIGYYGNRGEEWLTEESGPGQGFLSESCLEWEKAIQEVSALGIRTVAFRIGIVLSSKGGALPKLNLPVRFRLAPYFGNGKQWYSWIHIDDLCRMFAFALKKESCTGVFNAIGPEPERNKSFMEKLAAVCGKKALVFPVPGILLWLGMGEMADTVLYSARVRAGKILLQGFEYLHPDLGEALKDLSAAKV
ncbi:MAG: TIGR01777 family protein [Haliscomenobacter sp.]|nr:TIGR01777 family protein [Haliscomenobacter sp.]